MPETKKITFGKRTTSTAVYGLDVRRLRKNSVRFDPGVDVTSQDKKRGSILVKSKVTQIPVFKNNQRAGTIIGANIVKANLQNPNKTKVTNPKSAQQKWRLEVNSSGNKPGRVVGGGSTGGRTTLPEIRRKARKILR